MGDSVRINVKAPKLSIEKKKKTTYQYQNDFNNLFLN